MRLWTPYSLHPHANILTASRYLAAEPNSLVLVVYEEKVIGTLSCENIVCAVSSGRTIEEVSVQDFMTPKPLWLHDGEPVINFLTQARRELERSALVVVNEEGYGVISEVDVPISVRYEFEKWLDLQEGRELCVSSAGPVPL